MTNTNIGKTLTDKLLQFRLNPAAEFSDSLSTESYKHYLGLESSAEWLDANSHRDLANIFKNFAKDVFENCVESRSPKAKMFEQEEKGFAVVTGKNSKSEIVRHILRRNIFETRHLIKKIRNKFRNKIADERTAKHAGKILTIYERQLFWLKIFLRHRSEKLI